MERFPHPEEDSVERGLLESTSDLGQGHSQPQGKAKGMNTYLSVLLLSSGCSCKSEASGLSPSRSNS